MSGTQKARIFKNGRSQAVRIPAEFRFSANEVYIERNPNTGALTLSEKPPRPTLSDVYRELDEAGAAGLELDRDLSLPINRDWL